MEKYPFTNHKLYLNDLDSIFLFSDGMQDQFSEELNKFSTQRLRKLLAEKGLLPMSELDDEIRSTYSDWKGDAQQTDDMLLMGVRFN